ncbi:hypothetical protein HPP92_010878 [Vanilla planifolia]|uniref:Uncharacterized protein n=1 Tax=Vanilla planifolia TaxID=51239 RepID=A0A835QUP5_VANPL|nr:hypothetical protein HPP92_010878 [Vanilla planifolia]
MHYEERERILLKGKSRLPGRRCSADFIPTTSVSMERAVTIDEEKVGTAEQHTTEAAEELVESNGRGAHKMCNGRFYEAGNQQDVIVTPVGDEVDYSSSTDQDSDSSSCTPTKAVESLSRPAELIILGRSVGQLDCDGVNYIAKISSLCVDSQAGEVQSFSSKIDVITIGSMHIKLENKPALEFLL